MQASGGLGRRSSPEPLPIHLNHLPIFASSVSVSCCDSWPAAVDGWCPASSSTISSRTTYMQQQKGQGKCREHQTTAAYFKREVEQWGRQDRRLNPNESSADPARIGTVSCSDACVYSGAHCVLLLPVGRRACPSSSTSRPRSYAAPRQHASPDHCHATTGQRGKTRIRQVQVPQEVQAEMGAGWKRPGLVRDGCWAAKAGSWYLRDRSPVSEHHAWLEGMTGQQAHQPHRHAQRRC